MTDSNVRVACMSIACSLRRVAMLVASFLCVFNGCDSI